MTSLSPPSSRHYDEERNFFYPEDSLLVALQKLTDHGIGRLPVFNKETNEFVGLITRSNLFSTYEKNIAR
jgi:CBS domain-containing protein